MLENTQDNLFEFWSKDQNEASRMPRLLLSDSPVTVDGQGCTEIILFTEDAKREEVDFTVFPNPTTNDIHIKYHSIPTECLIEIFSITGQRCMQQFIEPLGDTIRVNVDLLSPGIYFISLNGHMRRFVIN